MIVDADLFSPWLMSSQMQCAIQYRVQYSKLDVGLDLADFRKGRLASLSLLALPR